MFVIFVLLPKHQKTWIKPSWMCSFVQFSAQTISLECQPSPTAHVQKCQRSASAWMGFQNFFKISAAGPDGVPCHLLQVVATEFAPALTILFQRSLWDISWQSCLLHHHEKKNYLTNHITKNIHQSEGWKPKFYCLTCSFIKQYLSMQHLIWQPWCNPLWLTGLKTLTN